MRFLSPLVAVVAACALAAGCTTEVDKPATPPTSAAPTLPTRPREVRLDGVDPCSLLTPQQRASLDLDGHPLSKKSLVELFNGEVTTCTITGYSGPPLALDVGAVTTSGVERWQRGDIDARLSSTSVNGFPGLVAIPTRFTNYCSVEVDVAPGQLLDVQMSDGGGRAPVPQQELCSRAERAADELIESLLAR